MAEIIQPQGGPTHVVETHAPFEAERIEHSTVSWRAIFAGTFIALLTYALLMSLGMAFGGANIQGLIQGEGSASAIGIGTGVWIALSTLISLAFGSYAASRVSGIIAVRVGRMQGLVVTSLFFLLMFMQVGSFLGTVGRGFGSVVGSAGQAMGGIASNPQVQDVIGDSLEGLDLRSSPEVVIEGLATRLIRGDTQGAVSYLSRQTGISRAEAETRLNELNQRFQTAASEVGSTISRGIMIAGWTLFGAILLGSIFAMLGGAAGASANLRAPISKADRRSLEKRRAA